MDLTQHKSEMREHIESLSEVKSITVKPEDVFITMDFTTDPEHPGTAILESFLNKWKLELIWIGYNPTSRGAYKVRMKPEM